jgi:hypothetical protein
MLGRRRFVGCAQGRAAGSAVSVAVQDGAVFLPTRPAEMLGSVALVWDSQQNWAIAFGAPHAQDGDLLQKQLLEP